MKTNEILYFFQVERQSAEFLVSIDPESGSRTIFFHVDYDSLIGVRADGSFEGYGIFSARHGSWANSTTRFTSYSGSHKFLSVFDSWIVTSKSLIGTPDELTEAEIEIASNSRNVYLVDQANQIKKERDAYASLTRFRNRVNAEFDKFDELDGALGGIFDTPEKVDSKIDGAIEALIAIRDFRAAQKKRQEKKAKES